MIKATMIVEIAGKPAEYVEETLKKHLEPLKEYKELTIIEQKISEARELEEQKGTYTSFAEVEFEAAHFTQLTEVIFHFMPSSIEVLEPANTNIDSRDMTELLNSISGRLHKYDEIAKLAHMRLQHAATIIKKAEEQGFTLKENTNEKKEQKKEEKKA